MLSLSADLRLHWVTDKSAVEGWIQRGRITGLAYECINVKDISILNDPFVQNARQEYCHHSLI